MSTLFLYASVIGGTFLICQFVMTLLGLGDGMEGTGDLTDLDGGVGHFDDSGASHGGNLHSDHLHSDDPHHSSWLFGIISFRTLVAATTFFGLTGMAMNKAGSAPFDQMLVAVASGVAAMFGVHWLMNSFHKLNQSGTLKLQNAIGRHATVLVPVPHMDSGLGKVQIEVQGRLEELAAVNVGPVPLKTGTRVQVVGVEAGNILKVDAIPVAAGLAS